MNRITVKAPAKINLSLDIVGKREDGYHEIRSIMQNISVYDTVTLERTPGDGFVLQLESPAGRPLSAEEAGLPTDGRNLVLKAAHALSERAESEGRLPDKRGVKITLRKEIPMAAGLAGGSADAAAVLYGLNQLWDLGYPTEALSETGAKIGADIPFCLYGGTCLAEGIGERVTKLPVTPSLHLVLVKPPVDVSTKEIYTRFDSLGAKPRNDTDRLLPALLENTDSTHLSAIIGNALQEVSEALCPVIPEIRLYCTKNGACGAFMSGSGPTVIALYETAEKAEFARQAIASEFPGFAVKTAKSTEFGLEETDI